MLSEPSSRDPVVVLAADDRFAMPLAATVRSVLDNLAADRRLHIYVMDGGLTDDSRAKLIRSWPRGQFAVEFLKVDPSVLAGVPESGHVNVVSYFRLLMPRVLPATLDRVIYLDSDVIACTDISRLWDLEFQGNLCLAAQDCATPFIDSSIALANYELCRQHMGVAQPIPNFRDLGLASTAPYFNAGILLVDLAAWRRADITTKALDCLERYRQHVMFWDQYAMNVTMAGQWGALDIRWNQGWHAFKYPNWRHSPFDQKTFEQLQSDPYIIHYTTRFKPWHAALHPLRREFFKYMDRTAWTGWRPPRVKRMLELIKVPERRFRHGRNWLKNRALQWLGKAA